jgi:very-short-patch-repair endonuclease
VGRILPRTKPITRKARELRGNLTDAERVLWHRLRGKQLGVAFRRQYPVGPYIADFACTSLAIIIELDGGQHAERKGYDARRDAFLLSKDFSVLRFWNHEVMGELESVLAVIWREIESARQRLSPSQPPPHTGEE